MRAQSLPVRGVRDAMRARGLRCETVAAMTVSRNGRRALLGGSVDIGRKYLSVPVHGFFDVGLIEDIHRDWLAFDEPQYRARHRTVVANGLDDLARTDSKRRFGDPEFEIAFDELALARCERGAGIKGG